MRNLFISIILMLYATAVAGSAHSDSINIGWDSLDKLHKELSDKSADIKTKIDEAEKKIEAAKAANEKKPNYWIPIAGGAVLGIALAFWLRKRKKAK